jgi:hypothetical protein
MKIRRVGAELFHVKEQTDWQAGRQAGRQTDMVKLVVPSRNIANAPNECAVEESSSMCRMEKEMVCLWLVTLY